MDSDRLSAKRQVVIPKLVREALGLRPGRSIHVLLYRGRVELIPERPMSSMRGFLRGIDASVPREADRV
jgi:AbrB family looped-hinge helix DNA binding protein